MELNKDPKIIVMDIEMFARLLKYAKEGEMQTGEGYFGSTLKEIKQHVNRKNTFLRDAKANTENEKRAARHKDRLDRKRCYAILSMRNSTDFYYADANERKLIKANVRNVKKYDYDYSSACVSGTLDNGEEFTVSIHDIHIDHPKYENEYIAYLLNVEGYSKIESSVYSSTLGMADSSRN